MSDRFTRKQYEIIDCIRRGTPDGDFIDLDQLIETIGYETSKQSMQFSIRALVARGVVEKKPTELRRGRRRVVYALTKRGYEMFGAGAPHVVVLE